MANFYITEDLDGPEIGDEIVLEGAEARHAATVSRTRAGERILIGNGRGLRVGGSVLSAESARILVRVDTVDRTGAATPRMILVQALAKGGRDELAIQAATELGIDVVIPWSAERSVVQWNVQKSQRGYERWSAIAREAAKQSVRPWLPEVRRLMATKDLVGLASGQRMLLLEPTAADALSSITVDDRDLALVVGPEGGISPSELALLTKAGAQAVRLGQSVLRTSTAGPAALAALNAQLGRW